MWLYQTYYYLAALCLALHYHATRIARFMHSLNSHFRLRSSGERVELIHIMKDEGMNLCMVESPRAGRIIVREEELELEIQHIGAAVLVCVGLVLAGGLLGYSFNI